MTNRLFRLYLLYASISIYFALSSTNETSITSDMCLFMCKIHLKHCSVKYVENYSRKKCKKNIKKKHIFVPSQRYQDSRSLLKKS